MTSIHAAAAPPNPNRSQAHQAGHRQLALWASIALGASIAAIAAAPVVRRAAVLVSAAPVAVEERAAVTIAPYAFAARAMARSGTACASELALLVRAHPARVGRAVLVEEGMLGPDDPQLVDVLQLIEGRRGLLEALATDLGRLAPDGAGAPSTAATLAARAHRIAERLCVDRDVARGTAAMARR